MQTLIPISLIIFFFFLHSPVLKYKPCFRCETYSSFEGVGKASMDVFAGNWAMEMGDPTVQFQDTVNPNLFCMMNGGLGFQSFSPESRSSEVTVDPSVLFPPAKHLRKDNSSQHGRSFTAMSSSSPSSQIISFGTPNPAPATAQAPATPRVMFQSAPRSGQNPQEHVISERKRREKLSRRFVSLSAIVPGLKKRDKASVLEEATKYVKELQGKVKALEEQTKTKVVESVVLVKRNRVVSADEDDGRNSSALPEIEAKVSEDNLLLKIHCQNHHGLSPSIISEIHNLNLTLLCSSILPFGHYSCDVTIIAKMGHEFKSTVREVLNRLKTVLTAGRAPGSDF